MIKCRDQKINAYVKVKGGQVNPRKYCKDCFNKSHRKQRTFVPGKSAGNDDKEKDSDTTSRYTRLVPLSRSNHTSAALDQAPLLTLPQLVHPDSLTERLWYLTTTFFIPVQKHGRPVSTSTDHPLESYNR